MPSTRLCTAPAQSRPQRKTTKHREKKRGARVELSKDAVHPPLHRGRPSRLQRVYGLLRSCRRVRGQAAVQLRCEKRVQWRLLAGAQLSRGVGKHL